MRRRFPRPERGVFHQPALAAATAVAIAVFGAGLLIFLLGHDPLIAFGALLAGALASGQGISEVTVETCPLLLTGLAVGLSFRAGRWNIGAEGQLLAGAVAYVWVGTSGLSLAASWAVTAALLSAAIAGAAWAAIAAALREWRNVDEVIATILLNFLAASLVGWLVQGPMMESSGQYPQTDAVAPAFRMARIVPGYRAHTGIVLGLAAVFAVHLLLFRTRIGFQLRAAGINPEAARLAGFRPQALGALGLIAGGALAGLAGGIQAGAVTWRLYEKFSPGYGYTAIAVALLGRLHPAGILLAAAFFGILQAGAGSMQRRAGVSAVLVAVIQAVALFSLLAFEWRMRQSRAATSSTGATGT